METLEFDQDGRRVYPAGKEMPDELYQNIKKRFSWVKKTEINISFKYKGFTIYHFSALDDFFLITKDNKIFGTSRYYMLGHDIKPEIKKAIDEFIKRS